jgi:hypothetical protein
MEAPRSWSGPWSTNGLRSYGATSEKDREEMDRSIFPETGMWEPMMDTTYKMDTEAGAKEAHLEQLDQCSKCPKLTANGGCLLAKHIIGLDLLVGIPKDDVKFANLIGPIMIRFKYENQPSDGLQN